MSDPIHVTMSKEDSDALISALQGECDAFITWKRAAEVKKAVEDQMREKYITKRESQQSG